MTVINTVFNGSYEFKFSFFKDNKTLWLSDIFFYNPEQKYFEESKKIKPNWTRAESFDLILLRNLWPVSQSFYFWKKDWALGSISTLIWHFSNIF